MKTTDDALDDDVGEITDLTEFFLDSWAKQMSPRQIAEKIGKPLGVTWELLKQAQKEIVEKHGIGTDEKENNH